MIEIIKNLLTIQLDKKIMLNKTNQLLIKLILFKKLFLSKIFRKKK